MYRALCGKQGGNVVHRHLHRLIGAPATRNTCNHTWPPPDPPLPADVVAEFYSSATLGLLIWWVDHDFRYGPARMAAMHHQLAAPGVIAALTDLDIAAHRATPTPARRAR